MKPYKQLVNEVIRSLNSEIDNWEFNKCSADNNRWGIRIWIANAPILDLYIHYPTAIKFNLWDKIRIYRALSKCRALKIIKLNNNETPR